MRRELPLIIAFLAGVIMILDYFIPQRVVSVSAQTIRDWAIIVVAFAYILGVANIVKVSGERVARKGPDWVYKLIMLICLFFMVFAGIFNGIKTGTIFNYFFRHIYTPMEASMFALLAFFISSAAYRAFRVRTLEATLLLVTAIIIMIGRVPLEVIYGENFPKFVEWIMNVPNMAGQRGIMLGAALGAIAMGLRTILGIERSYLGGD